MTTPAYDIGDRVQFTAPFVDNLVYIVTRIQYLNENNEFIEGPSENWQYELSQVVTNSVEDYLEPVP